MARTLAKIGSDARRFSMRSLKFRQFVLIGVIALILGASGACFGANAQHGDPFWTVDRMYDYLDSNLAGWKIAPITGNTMGSCYYDKLPFDGGFPCIARGDFNGYRISDCAIGVPRQGARYLRAFVSSGGGSPGVVHMVASGWIGDVMGQPAPKGSSYYDWEIGAKATLKHDSIVVVACEKAAYT